MTEDATMEAAADLRARVAALEHKVTTQEQRVSVIEQWRQQMDIFNARRDEQFKNLMEKFEALNRKIDNVQTSLAGDIGKLAETLQWLARLIIGGIITGVIGGSIALLFALAK